MKKYLRYILITLVILVGLFGPTGAKADQAAYDACIARINAEIRADPTLVTTQPGTYGSQAWINGQCAPALAAPAGQAPNIPTPVESTPTQDKQGLGNNLPACLPITSSSWSLGGCVVNLAYFLFVTIPSWLLILAGMFFNALVALTINSKILGNTEFISNAWEVVRDLSNVFFILVLLYIAIQIILDIGHDAKKMIARVIVMALLINFSMFFTKIIIDSSNILALIFYNKIDTETTLNGQKSAYVPATNSPVEKDISGGLMKAFNPGDLLSAEFFQNAKTNTAVIPPGIGSSIVSGLVPIYGAYNVLVGHLVPSGEVSMSLMLGIIVVSGLIMLFATYCFFVAGLSFLSRLIELWILIVFSPFAFMSSTIPELSGVSYIGWKEWMHRLLTVSFMAPIFMFFMYFIFMLLQADIFRDVQRGGSGNPATTTETVLFVIIPAMLILILLLKAADFAKKGSGKLGEVVMKTAAVATGIVGGLAIGGVAAGLQGTAGHIGKNVFESRTLAEWETNKEKGPAGWSKRLLGSKLRDIGGGAYESSFDARKGVVGGALKTVSAVTGINVGAQSQFLSDRGSYKDDLARRDKIRKERAEGLKIKEGEPEKQHLNEVKENHQRMALQNESKIHELDRDIKAAESNREAYRNVPGQEKNFEKHANRVIELKAQRGEIKNGGFDEERGEYRTDNGKISKAELEKRNKIEEVTTTMAANASETATKASAALVKATADAAAAIADKAKAVAEASAALVKAKSNADAAVAKTITTGSETLARTKSTVEANEAKAMADEVVARREAAAATDELNLLETRSPISLTPGDIAVREAARAKAKKAAEDAAKATEAVAKVTTDGAKAVAAAEAKAMADEVVARREAAKSIDVATAAEAKAMADEVVARREAAKSIDVATAVEAKAMADEVVARRQAGTATAAATTARTAAEAGFGNSMNDYEDKLIPEAEHHIKEVNDTRTRNFADNIQNQWWHYFNKTAREQSAHEIRMGVKPEKSHGGGAHHDVGIAGHLAIGALTEKIFGDSHSAPAAAHDAGHDAAPSGGHH